MLLFKAGAVEEDSEIIGMNKDERKSDVNEESDRDEELDDNEFEVDRILNVAVIDGQIKYKVIVKL